MAFVMPDDKFEIYKNEKDEKKDKEKEKEKEDEKNETDPWDIPAFLRRRKK